MIQPQYLLPLHREQVIDLFAGGGGASTGIEQAIGRAVDVAINHDPEAVALHKANHPQTLHYVSDVFEVDPRAVTDGRPVGLLWASPDCKHFSKAKGGKPVSKKIRSLAWVVVKWGKSVRPRVICLENVEEFQTWGPLTADNKPCPLRKGRTFRRWKRSLERMGYVVEHRELRACDYGAPTIRRRLFLVARCDGAAVVWPEPTHGAPDSLGVKARKLQPWRTAARCIDWSIPCPSIFERTKPLADATCRRIAKGLVRFVIEAKNPFIVPAAIMETGYGERPGQSPRAQDVSAPLGTVVGSQKHALVSAFLAKHYGGVVGTGVEVPTGTITTSDHHSVVTATMMVNTSWHPGAPPDEPLRTVTTGGHHGLITAVHVGVGGRAGQSRPRAADEPVATLTSKADTALITSNLVKLRGTSTGAQSVQEPLHTVSAQGMHHAEVRAFLVKYYGAEIDGISAADPLHTIPTHDRFGLVTVLGEQYQIVDIGLRMLSPRELYLAQGFPESYRIEVGADGRALTKKAQVRMCGNSVCPPVARAIVAANYVDAGHERIAA